MAAVEVQLADRIATVVLERGKVNALNPAVVAELSSTFARLKTDPAVRAVVLAGRGPFFSFGFDVPELYSATRAEFTSFATSFTALYRDLFTLPKPLIAALNGHAVAGGCMLALACDAAIVVDGPAKISLNEIAFGSSIFAGSAEMLVFRTASHASEILYSGKMYAPAEARAVGLVAEVVAAATLVDRARAIAAELAARRPEAFASLKALLRAPVAAAMAAREPDSIREFVDIWYSEPTRSNLRSITIR